MACLSVQMAQIEKDPAFAAAGLTVLPIVMNTKDQITADMATNGVRTPFPARRYRVHGPTGPSAKACTPTCPATVSY